ncbi:MAG TPA: bifunctional UDP-sugar hydrolase/5'-nucleotidase [Bacilli bacterium]
MPVSTQKLFILHTNDIHSHFEQMPKIASVMETLKLKHAPHETLTIDCGDHMDRMRIETEGSDGLANIEVMNETGYEAVVLGNNEGLTNTQLILSEMYRNHAKFTVIGSNMFNASTGLRVDWMKPHQIVQKGDLRIGLIGVTMNYGDFYKLLDWDVQEPSAIIAGLVQKLRPEVHILVVISHMGLSFDKRLAEEMDGIDCILGGHTHHLLEEPLRINNTYIFATGKFGQYVGEIEIEYDFHVQDIAYVHGKCIETGTYANSPPIVRIIQEHLDKSKNKLNECAVVLNQSLENNWEQESPLGNLLAAGLRRWTGAEIGIVNAGVLMEGLIAGGITREILLALCPSPINPCRMLLLGEHLKIALEEALLAEFVMKPIKGFGFRGAVLGTLCLDGITVSYDPLGEPYQRITQVLVNGEPLDLEREYLTGTIDMFTFGIGYISLSKGTKIEYFLPEFLRDVLLHQLQDPKAIRECTRLNWIM